MTERQGLFTCSTTAPVAFQHVFNEAVTVRHPPPDEPPSLLLLLLLLSLLLSWKVLGVVPRV